MDCLKLIACNSSKNFKFKFINTKYITWVIQWQYRETVIYGTSWSCIGNFSQFLLSDSLQADDDAQSCQCMKNVCKPRL
jgi:hypothetical protein